jgi:hypothetical protein
MNVNKPVLPPIDDELVRSPHRRVDLRGLKPRKPIDDSAVEANSRALGERWGASTSLSPNEGTGREAEALGEVSIASLRLEVPDYLDNELTLKAAQGRVTKAFLVMSALAQAGYRIDPKDLVPDRRKARSRKM